MIGYAIVDKDSNIIKNIMSWGDREISENYPLKDSEYLLSLNEDKYVNVQNNIVFPNKKLKILNKDGLTYTELIEEIIEEVLIDKRPTAEERLALLEAAMNDLLLGGA